jgi:diguanylate cyclase (GGDEF)-like protein
VAVPAAAEAETGASDDPVHEALGGLFSQVHELLAHLPGRHDEPSPEPVSGLMSEAAVRARLEEEVARARRYGGTLSILLIDVDETGTPELEAAAHTSGNVVRRQVSETIGAALVRHLRQMDCSGRFGADGFLVLLPETGAEEALGAGARFGQVVGQAIEEHVASLGTGEAPAFELRCGVTTFPVAAQEASILLAQAEEALRATRFEPDGGWLRHALPHLNRREGRGFKCVCRRCGRVFEVDDRAHQRARRFCSHSCYVADRRASERGRDAAIREARSAGASLRELAQRFGISAERVRQICLARGVAEQPSPPVAASAGATALA